MLAEDLLNFVASSVPSSNHSVYMVTSRNSLLGISDILYN